MKTRKEKRPELNVDTIGFQDVKLTKEEESSISEYLRSRKAKTRNRSVKDKACI
jgi:hypothetical protein